MKEVLTLKFSELYTFEPILSVAALDKKKTAAERIACFVNIHNFKDTHVVL